MKILHFFVILFFLSEIGFSQVNFLQFSNIRFNKISINPAFSGWNSSEIESIILAQSNWIGIDGAPQSQLLSVSIPLYLNFGGGAVVRSRQLGFSNHTDLELSASYQIRVGVDSFISLGIGASAGLTNIYFSQSNAYGIDIAIPEDLTNSVKPNISVGAVFKHPKYYVGLSLTKLLRNELDIGENNQVTFEGAARNIALIGGSVHKLFKNVILNPITLISYNINNFEPLQIRLSSNFILFDRFTLGFNYALSKNISYLASFNINKNLAFGVSYSKRLKDLSQLDGGIDSLEFMLKLNFLTGYARSNYTSSIL